MSERQAYFERLLQDHVIAPWFPRCIDREHGGFLMGFDRRWRPLDTDGKLLESQARQTLVAAELLQAYPGNAALAEATSSGFHFLKEIAWDHADGGWFWKLDRGGRPAGSGYKHLHSMAYAVQACAAVHAATGDPDALALARTAFDWIDDRLHDNAHGGYLQVASRAGRALVDPGEFGAPADHMGTPIGCKDCNSQFDFLEALTYLLPRIGHAGVARRHDEMIAVAIDEVARPGQILHYLYRRDWQPASTLLRPMQTFQLASRLIEARHLHAAPARLEETALRVVGDAVGYGWRERYGGFVFEHAGDADTALPAVDEIQWWGSIEAHKALRLCRDVSPSFALGDFAETVWAALMANFCDRRCGGFYGVSLKSLRPRDRLLKRAKFRKATDKGGAWKDASHEGRALLRLAGLFVPPRPLAM